MSKESSGSDWTERLANDSLVRVAGCDIDGIARGKTMSKSKFLKICTGSGFGFCDVVFGWDCHDKLYTVQPENSEFSFADLLAVPDMGSFRRIPWEHNIPFFLIDFVDPKTKELLSVSPRGLLKRILSSSKKATGGLEALCGMEYEFYNFKETPDSLKTAKGVNLQALTPGMFGYSLTRPLVNQAFFEAIYAECLKFGVPLEAIHAETGPGVYEAALEYSDALSMADRSHLFKTAVKQIGVIHGITPCFMAKPYANLPGCSGHIHVSLKGPDGLNAFRHTANGIPCKTLSQSLAGLLSALPSLMAVFAPTINSYKRLVENYWAPVTVSWGFETRTTAIRVIAPPTCEPGATRIEVRVPGADVNPYLAIAAIVGAISYGVENELELTIPASSGLDKSGKLPGERLPKALKEASLKMMEVGSLARSILGDAFVEHYAATRLHECREWDTTVTDWELTRYMETI